MSKQAAIFDQYTIDVRDRKCTGCKFAASDPDGGFCAHDKSLKISSGFGRSWNAARMDESLCGQSGKLFEPMEIERARALGTAR